MTADFGSDLDSRTLITRIRAGEVQRDFLLLVARGFLPMSQEDLVSVLLFLTTGEDEEVADLSRASMRELPPRIILNAARDPELSPEQLGALALTVTDAPVLEAVLRNRSTSDETFEQLASRVGSNLQDVIVINQERILRRPSILEALLTNPGLSADVRRRALEIREEFFEKQRPAAAPPVEEPPSFGDEIEDVELTPEQQAELDALLNQASAQPDPAVGAATEAAEEGEEDEENTDSAWRRIMKMSVAQKVQTAYKGGMTERGILIRERNKLVCTAVLRSPRITETEVEAFAAMRNIEEEALRIIGTNRQWLSKYTIMLALVKNPKAPIAVVLPLIIRLTLKDLKFVSSDKGVSEAVRSTARRIYAQKRSQ